MWWKRYESILERKPVEAKEALINLLAQEIEEVVAAFPPAEHEVSWDDPRLKARFAGRLETLPPVDVAMAALLAEVLILDLTHESEAIDHMLRNDRHKVACPTVDHEDAFRFLWRGTLEHLYVRKEDANGALKSADLVTIVERFLARFKHASLHIQ